MCILLDSILYISLWGWGDQKICKFGESGTFSVFIYKMDLRSFKKENGLDFFLKEGNTYKIIIIKS